MNYKDSIIEYKSSSERYLKRSLVDVPVLLWVFVRPEMIRKVFDVIRQARPSVLFFVSDGPRDNFPTDLENIKASRAIVEDIDWECKVHKLYFEKNQGLYPIGVITNKYIFEKVDRCIFLEDDVITSVGFFKYCETLLDLYKDDLRVNLISGMNHLGVYDECPSDYFFVSGAGSIWGFAMWRRTFEKFYDLRFTSEKYYITRIAENAKSHKDFANEIVGYCRDPNYGGHPPGFEFYNGISAYAHNQLTIVPRMNMVCNIGYGAGAAHNNLELKHMPKRIQKFFNMQIHEQTFPLVHPQYFVRDEIYKSQILKLSGHTFFSKYAIRIEAHLRRIFYKLF